MICPCSSYLYDLYLSDVILYLMQIFRADIAAPSEYQNIQLSSQSMRSYAGEQSGTMVINSASMLFESFLHGKCVLSVSIYE